MNFKLKFSTEHVMVDGSEFILTAPLCEIDRICTYQRVKVMAKYNNILMNKRRMLVLSSQEEYEKSSFFLAKLELALTKRFSNHPLFHCLKPNVFCVDLHVETFQNKIDENILPNC